MSKHEFIAWLSAFGPIYSGSCIGFCTLLAAFIMRTR